MKKNILAAILVVSVATASVGLEELKERARAIGEYRQDEVEQLMENFIAVAYEGASEDDSKKAAEELKDIMTAEEIETLKSEIGYNANGYKVQQVEVYYVSAENSSDGRPKEFLDLKVGNDSVNYMYLIEFTINSDGKIFTHTIWRH